MTVGGQTEARASTIIDYPFDQGFTVDSDELNFASAESELSDYTYMETMARLNLHRFQN